MAKIERPRQASIIAYVDNFKLLLIVSLPMLPMLLLMHRPQAHRWPRAQRCRRGRNHPEA